MDANDSFQQSRIHRPANLRRYTFLALAGIGMVELFAIPFDCGRYAEKFQQNGLVGVLGLPSVLVAQICFLLAIISLVVFSFCNGMARVSRVLVSLFGGAVGVYSLSVFLIYEASLRGEFGVGAAGFAVLFGFLPSAVFLLVGVPFTIFYAIRKPCA